MESTTTLQTTTEETSKKTLAETLAEPIVWAFIIVAILLVLTVILACVYHRITSRKKRRQVQDLYENHPIHSLQASIKQAQAKMNPVPWTYLQRKHSRVGVAETVKAGLIMHHVSNSVSDAGTRRKSSHKPMCESVTKEKESVTKAKESVTKAKESATKAKESVAKAKESATKTKEIVNKRKVSATKRIDNGDRSFENRDESTDNVVQNTSTMSNDSDKSILSAHSKDNTEKTTTPHHKLDATAHEKPTKNVANRMDVNIPTTKTANSDRNVVDTATSNRIQNTDSSSTDPKLYKDSIGRITTDVRGLESSELSLKHFVKSQQDDCKTVNAQLSNLLSPRGEFDNKALASDRYNSPRISNFSNMSLM